MSSPAYCVRRATVDDLSILQSLWAAMHLPAADLERRLTEFQVAEFEDGSIQGAIGMEISGRVGKIHSEAYHDFALAEVLRPLFWERLQSLATNHGLTRLWTRESAPFWTRNGFHAPDANELKKLPAAWGIDSPGWTTIRLRDEEALEAALDKEFNRFKLEEKKRTDKMLRRGRILNFIGIGLTILLFVGILTFTVIWAMKNYPRFFGR